MPSESVINVIIIIIIIISIVTSWRDSFFIRTSSLNQMNSLACNNAGDGDDCDDGDNHDDDEGDGDDCGDDSDDFHLGITRTGEQARHCYVSTFFHGQHLQS